MELLELLLEVPGFETVGLPNIAMAQLYCAHADCEFLRGSRDLQAPPPASLSSAVRVPPRPFLTPSLCPRRPSVPMQRS